MADNTHSKTADAPPRPRVSWPRIARRIRVPLSFAFAIAYVWLAQPTWLALAIGMPTAAVGLAIRASAAGHVRKDKVLTITGPYAYSRNPLYLGSLIIGIGFAVASRSIWVLIALVALLLAIYFPLIFAEEHYLRATFPDYDEYASNVPRLLPTFRVSRSSFRDSRTGQQLETRNAKLETAFSTELYRKHREYRATLGALAVFAILVAKILLRGRV